MSSSTYSGMTFIDMLSRLEEFSGSTFNDKRQRKYGEYITMFLSHFGKERCMLTGSTIEQTRLRLSKNEGDYDFLIISEIVIPMESVEYRKDLPSFIHINGSSLKKKFPGVQLIDDKYLPSSLLSEIHPEAFSHLRDLYQIVTRFNSFREERHSLSIVLNQKIKLGMSIQTYHHITCEEIPSSYEKPPRDGDKIEENVKKCLENEPEEFGDFAISSVKAIGSLFNENDTFHSEPDNPTPFKQICGSLVTAVEKATENGSPKFKEPKSKPMNKTMNIPRTTSTETSCSSEPNESLLFEKNHVSKNTDPNKSDLIKIEYNGKSSKDYIPCFPLSGKPKHMEDWKIRQRTSNWPGQDVIDDIYDSGEFFVVAKPAIHKPDIHKDFCLAYNIPEKKLAKALTRVQKNVLLIIKAIHKSFLAEYCDEITTFHWKTALYWESECVEPSLLHERTEENVLCFLQGLLERMTRSLCDGKLVHYFNSTNLFAGKETDLMLEIVPKIVEIQENPIGLLYLFFLEQDDDKPKKEWIPREKIVEFQNHENDIGEHSLVAQTLALLGAFSKEDKEKMKIALTEVLKATLPFIIEENSKGKLVNKNDTNSDIIQTALATIVNKDSLVAGCVSLLLDNIYNRKMTAEEIIHQFQALVLQNIFGNLFR